MTDYLALALRQDREEELEGFAVPGLPGKEKENAPGGGRGRDGLRENGPARDDLSVEGAAPVGTAPPARRLSGESGPEVGLAGGPDGLAERTLRAGADFGMTRAETGMTAGPTAPAWAERRAVDGPGWLGRLARTGDAAALARSRRGSVTVTAPEQELPPALGAEDLDRAVERDARRYDGGFALY